jgi:hypothetical protein
MSMAVSQQESMDAAVRYLVSKYSPKGKLVGLADDRLHSGGSVGLFPDCTGKRRFSFRERLFHWLTD